MISKEYRCTGHCCRHFFLPYSYEQLQDMLDSTKDVVRCEDCKIIALMVIAIEPPDHLVEDLDLSTETAKYCYTCRHLSENGDCTIYNSRPIMCRDYPYGVRCRYPGCTYTGVGKVGSEQLGEEEYKDGI